MTASPTGRAGPRRGVLGRLYHGETEFRFVGRARRWFVVSAVLILIGLAGFAVRGLNLGIEFEGGNQWQVPVGAATVVEVEDNVAELGFSEVQVQEVGDDIRVRTPALAGSDAERSELNDDVVGVLTDLTGADSADVVTTEVSPSWGQEISEKALRALIFFLIAIVVYITIRFEFRMAVATVVALVHDLLWVVGVYAVFQLPVTPATVVAVLTILGFSIYDGIVVFDRVDENTRLLSTSARMTYSEMVDLSLNQVLMRSVNTQITAVIPILSVLIVGSLALGAETLQEFGLALFLGQVAGAYSSLFIASPLLALLKEREPRYRALRQRLAERAASGKGAPASAAPSTAAAPIPTNEPDADADADADEDAASVPAAARPAPATARTTSGPPSSRAHPPRPRKKGKKR